MKKLIVKIDRATIRKNPNAGNTVFAAIGSREITFTYTGDQPELLENCIICSEFSSGRIEGLIDNPEHAAKLENLQGMHITYSNNITQHHHAPEGKWLYSHENPMVKCSKCKVRMPVSQVINDSDDDYEFTVCPVCTERNTFPEIKYESIKEALKDIKSKYEKSN